MIYFKLNRLKLNVNKCFNITFTRKKNVLLIDKKIKNSKLIKVHEMKDLCIILDKKLLF